MDKKTVKQIIREELQKLSKLTWKQRLVYVWDYYKPLFAAIIGIMALISLGVTIYQNKQLNHLLHVYFINCNAMETDTDGMVDEFVERIGGIDEKDVITIDTTIAFSDEDSEYEMANQMKLMAMSAAQEMDVIIVDEEKYLQLEAQGYFGDLTTVLSEEQLEKWSDLLVEGTELEDGTIPITGIELTDSPLFAENNTYFGGKVYGTVAVSSVRPDLCGEFFSYLLGE